MVSRFCRARIGSTQGPSWTPDSTRTSADLDPLTTTACFLSERKFSILQSTSRYAILLEFMDKKAVAHFIKCFREAHLLGILFF